MTWYLMVLKKYAKFNGRSRRKEFWYFVLFYILFGVLFGVIDMLLIGTPILGTVYYLVFLIPFIAVGVRRLHDIGRSGWWMLFYAGPFLQWIASAVLGFGAEASEATALVSGIVGIVALVCLIVLIVFMVRKSQPGDNRYGSDPTDEAIPAG